MTEKSERRTDKRFRIDLITQVTAISADGEIFTENTLLRNMSGGGASFVTRLADRYFQGQRLDISIELPGTAELKASLQGTATVSRVEPLPDSGQRQDARRYSVAVVIAVPLQFVRKDARTMREKSAGELE
ncbi:MAG: PilZ domain-containing protein [Thermodesulfobacteriota bacterium]